MNIENNLESNIKFLIESAIQKHESGELSEAKLLYEQILQFQADTDTEQEYLKNQYYPTVLKKLGTLLEQQGKLDAAAESYRQALKLKPNYSDCYYNLGNVFLQQGNFNAAIESYQQALKIQPNDVEAHYNLGCVYKLQQNLSAAIQSYQQALKLRPDFLDAYCNLANSFYSQGNIEASLETYQQALEIQPDLAPAQFGVLICQLPIIYSSWQEVEQKRNNYQQRLEELAQSYKLANPKQLEKAAIAVGSVQPFYLAYQGYNDRDLQQTYGEMIVNIMSHRYPKWSQKLAIPELKPNEKIRIGFVSKFFYNHSNWKIPIKGWIENLDRSQFELFAYHTDFTRDKNTTTAAKEFDKFTQGVLHLEQWCELIKKDNLHILIFPEFGMDPITQQLGCLRLAPIQISSWGHPNTSGLPTIDYYLSSNLMEPENAQEHYTEKLVRLPNLSIYYTPLTSESLPISKKEIGINEEEIMFWCCQSLFKYLPQHDDVFARIAKELPNAKFVFIQRQSQQVTESFYQRLSGSFSEFGLCYQDYCVFLPPLKSNAFAGIASLADVFLDSIGWSGCNSTLESIVHNTPVVTLPGELMRARHSMAILKMMGVEETIATSKEDYIKIAVRLGQNAEYRQYVSGLVAQNKHKLYHDLAPVRALEEFLLSLVGKTRISVTPEIAETLRLAIQEQRDNNLDKAKLAYHQVLEIQPNHPEALYGLGILAQQTGEVQQAEQFLSAAAKVQPNSVKVWFSLGNLYQVQGQLPQAESAYKQAIALRPDAVSISNNLGYNLQQQGKLDEAITYYQKALELQPNCTEAKANLGNVLHFQGQLSQNQKFYYAALNNELGIKRQNAGDLLNAVTYYEQAIAIQPDLAVAHTNLGNVLQQQGRLNDAIHSYQQAINIQPDHTAYHNLGYILQQKGDLEQAIEAYQQALKIQPDAITHNNLGNIYKAIHQFDTAIKFYHQAIKINPNIDDIYYNLGITLKEQNKLDAAVEAFEQAVKLAPNNNLAKFGICFSQLPIIYHSAQEIESRRNQYQQHLLSLATNYNKANQQQRASSAEAIGSSQPFYLAYQGLNDRNLQQTYGEMICQLMASRYPQWCQRFKGTPQLAANEKIRIGFVSGYFYNHSNWKIPIKGWVENFDRSEFELFGYHTGIVRDNETTKAAKVFDKFTQGQLQLEQWCELIQKDNLHILIFPEFGMEPMTAQLGCLRLAPVQVTSWGHPNTSGLPTIDYYLSSDLMEPENAQEHYTEELVRLPNLSIHYTPLAIQPQLRSKREIGIAPDDIMFWSSQSLFKYLPQHDDVFPRIAKELTNAKFVFIQHHSQNVTEIFCQRLKHAFDEFGLNYLDFCILLPRLDTIEFANTVASSDVFLDSIGWSGCNSTLEAIAHNIPVVTIESDLMRGRHSMAILRMMGIQETIAATKEDYVKIAIRLGQDSQYRQHIARQVAENKQKLYGDLKPVRALEDFFFKVVNKSRRFAMAEVTETLQLAVQYQRANRLVEAQQLYHQVLEKCPNHPEALYNLGMLATQLGEPETALTWLIAATQVQPDVKTWFSLGNLRSSQEQYPEAVIAYRQALALRPDSLPIYNNLGYALQQQGLFDEAVNCYQKALEIKPDFALSEVNLGNVLQSLGKLSSSKQLYYAQLNLKLGAQRKKAGDLKTAVAYYKQAIALQPDMVEAYYELAPAQQAQGESEEAIASYQRALKLNPDDAEVYFKFAEFYQQQNNLEEAISAYRQGLRLINPCYAKAVESDLYGISQKLPVTPPIPQTSVQVGNNQFPGIGLVQSQQGKRPFWSVVIPVFAMHNRRQYLLQCLASVLMQWQGQEEMEILLIDDASEPPLYDLVNAIGSGIIRYYRNPQNMGAYRNFNIGVALSRGEWIHLLHDDDYILPGFYDRLKQSLEGCPESIGAAFTGYENIDETGKIVFTQQIYGKYRGIADNFLERIGVANPLNMPAVVVSQKVHEHLGGYLPELNYTGDWEFYKRIAAFYDWWCEPEILARYRQHSQNITTESILSGSQGTCLRRAIEVSSDYIPQEITAKSRSRNFDYCLSQAAIPLRFGKVDGAHRMVKEAVQIDSSSDAIAKLFSWLNQDEAALLREDIASKLTALSL